VAQCGSGSNGSIEKLRRSKPSRRNRKITTSVTFVLHPENYAMDAVQRDLNLLLTKTRSIMAGFFLQR
jgi:hypothetical protein